MSSKSYLQKFFDLFQRSFNFLWHNQNTKIEIHDLQNRLEREAAIRKITIGEASFDYIQGIEHRAGALLQHVSLMIALTTVYFVFSEDIFVINTILSLEIIGYLWAALCCLRCILHVSTNDIKDFNDENIVFAYQIEGMKRELILRHALQVLVILTVILGIIALTKPVILSFVL